jgi:xylan 1,4-beta-xylosidase
MKRTAERQSLFAGLLATLLGIAGAAGAAELTVDFGRTNGVIRALHGLNKGPLAFGGTVILTDAVRALQPPLIRLHDCDWPSPDVVDMHAVFPDSRADPARPESYDFRRTDEYLAAVRAAGAGIVYRLGESIEHTRVKRFVHPPADADRWTAAALGIVRHYNDGWAGGPRLGIRYWEIWNEPENRPAMWSGTDEDYFRLYRAASRAIKAHDPELKVGGPAVGYPGSFEAGDFHPSDFVAAFLRDCREKSLPLDFFSWHCYTDDPVELAARAAAIRQLLDANGFTKTESHLNEWNYLPGNRWEPLSPAASAADRRACREQMLGAAGAAFVAASLITLQDAPVDQCQFYHGEIGLFGLFDESGAPQRVYHALHAFARMLDTPCRLWTGGGTPGRIGLLAGLDPGTRRAAILVANFRSDDAAMELHLNRRPWPMTAEMTVINAERDGTTARPAEPLPSDGILRLELKAPAVALILLGTARP